MTNSGFPVRRFTRIRDFDYSHGGFYFLTLCTENRRCLFGDVIDGVMRLSEFGKIVVACWEEISSHFQFASLDSYVVMPNHLHGIITLSDDERASHDLPLQDRQTSGSKPGSITAIIGLFKSSVTRQINGMRPAGSPR
jgi:hypothetical protein